MKISELPQEIREKALEYQRNEKDIAYRKDSNDLGSSFDWESTKEGYAYWKKLQNQNVIEAIKESKGKLFYELDFNFISQMAERMQSNKENSKYPLWNWKNKMTQEGTDELKQALLRHVLAVMENDFKDDGRELGHLEAIANNAMMINYQIKK